MTQPRIALQPAADRVVPSSSTSRRQNGHVRDRSDSAASIALAAALAGGTASPPRPQSPRLLSPALRPISPLHAVSDTRPLAISIPASEQEGDEAREVDPNPPPPPEHATMLRQAAHYSSLVLAAMIGTLLRLGLQAMGRYEGAVVFPLVWAQGVGCGIMGMAVARKNQLYWWFPPMHTFIATGIAGSVTTFSTWMLEGFLAFSNFEGYSRSGFHDSVNGIAYSCTTLAVSVASLYLGYHVAGFLPSLPIRQAPVKRTRLFDLLTLASGFTAYLAALLIYFLAPSEWRPRVTFALLLAPPGAMLRYLLSRLNTIAPVSGKFPLGTFIANMTATLIIAGVYAAERRPQGISTHVRCDSLRALQDGFCGCLSTVSTFAVEITTMKRRRWRWIYLWVSIIVGHVFVLAVLGGAKWSSGLVEACRGSDF